MENKSVWQQIYYEQDAPIDALKGKKVGRQSATAVRDMPTVRTSATAASRSPSPNCPVRTISKSLRSMDLAPTTIKTAMDGAALIIITLPDEVQGKVYEYADRPNLKAGQTLGFCHGFNIHFKLHYAAARMSTSS